MVDVSFLLSFASLYVDSHGLARVLAGRCSSRLLIHLLSVSFLSQRAALVAGLDL